MRETLLGDGGFNRRGNRMGGGEQWGWGWLKFTIHICKSVEDQKVVPFTCYFIYILYLDQPLFHSPLSVSEWERSHQNLEVSRQQNGAFPFVLKGDNNTFIICKKIIFVYTISENIVSGRTFTSITTRKLQSNMNESEV